MERRVAGGARRSVGIQPAERPPPVLLTPTSVDLRTSEQKIIWLHSDHGGGAVGSRMHANANQRGNLQLLSQLFFFFTACISIKSPDIRD